MTPPAPHAGPSEGRGVVALLRRQNELFRQLQRLCCRQRELVVQDDPHPLLALLAKRQQIVESLGAVHRELGPLRTGEALPGADLDDQQRREAGDLLGQAGQMLQAILEADEEDGHRLAARKAQITCQVQAVDRGRHVFQAYRAAAGRPGQRTDQSA